MQTVILEIKVCIQIQCSTVIYYFTDETTYSEFSDVSLQFIGGGTEIPPHLHACTYRINTDWKLNFYRAIACTWQQCDRFASLV